MPQRYFKPNLKKIESLRIKHGLSVVDFAEKAELSRRTLDSLMNNKRVLMKTISSIAQALDVSVDSLLPGHSENPEPKDPRVTIRIEMGIPIESFTDSVQMEFKDLLRALLQSTDHINVTSVVSGSTIVTLDMSERDAIRLIYLALNTKDDPLSNSQSDKSLTRCITKQQYKRAGQTRYRFLRQFVELSSEELIAELISEARKPMKEYPCPTIYRVTRWSEIQLSFQVEEDARLLQKQPATKRDLRKYKISGIKLVLSGNRSKKQERSKKQKRSKRQEQHDS